MGKVIELHRTFEDESSEKAYLEAEAEVSQGTADVTFDWRELLRILFGR